MATGPVPIAESGVLRAFAEKTPGSRVLHSRAKALFRNGVTRVGRFLDPFPIYVERASGSRKCDVDGNDAVIRQAAKGAHYRPVCFPPGGAPQYYSVAPDLTTLAEILGGGYPAAAIRDGINAAIRRRGLKWCPYGQFSDPHLYCGNKIRAGVLVHGVDIAAWPGGFTSTAHPDDDVAPTVAAFESTFDLLASEGAL